MSKPAKRINRKSSTLLSCEHCGAEAQVIADIDDPHFDLVDAIDQWNDEHGPCSQPDPVRKITEFNAAITDKVPLSYKWQVGDPAPAWMGARPAWADDHHDTVKGFLPSKCFWSSPAVVIPLTHSYGAKSDDKSRRFMGCFDVRLRQSMDSRQPLVEIKHGAKSAPASLSMTFDEARTLIGALELLISLGEVEPQLNT